MTNDAAKHDDDYGELLVGGVANAGSITRSGDFVFRPAGAHTPTIHALFRHLRSHGFYGAPEPFEIANGRERLGYIEGIVPHFPFPAWCTADDTLAKVAAALRQYHDAAKTFVIPPDAQFCLDLADPDGGTIICHNDALPENVVFRDGAVAGIIDFDFAAPGSLLWDIARCLIVWIPIDEPELAHSYNFGGLNPFRRLKLFCDSYGLPVSERALLVDTIERSGIKCEAYVKSQVDAGKPAFVEMWNTFEIGKIYDRRRLWLKRNRSALITHISA
jgi:hypothetical protein